MKSLKKFTIAGVAAGLLGFISAVGAAVPSIAITEWMYNGSGAGSLGEYVEFTNMSSAPIDMTGWSFDDNTRTPGSQSLSAFGTVQPDESVILTDDTAAHFASNWNLPASVKIIGGNSNNLGRDDEINLYDASNNLVDRLTYGDDTSFPGTIRTNSHSGGPTADSVLGTNTVSQWSFVDSGGDPHGVGVFTSSLGEIGNPGRFVPEPASIGLLAALLPMLAIRRRRH